MLFKFLSYNCTTLAIIIFSVVIGTATGCQFTKGENNIDVISIQDYGAVGDGKTDDGPALRKALIAAQKSKKIAKVEFNGDNTYRLDAYKGTDYQMLLKSTDSLTIEGNGASLLLNPANGVLQIRNSQYITVKNFKISYSPLPFTQGTIKRVNTGQGYFDLTIQQGYALPPADSVVKKVLGQGGWWWGSVMDAHERHRKWDVLNHLKIASINRKKGRVYRIKLKDRYAKELEPVHSGDRFVLPFISLSRARRVQNTNVNYYGNFEISGSSHIKLANITIHTARSGMNYLIHGNEGPITLKNDSIAFKKGSNNLITSWKDGMHIEDNRVGPTIEGCYFEGMLDDAINFNSNTAMATKIISPKKFVLKGPPFHKGDSVLVYDAKSGKIILRTHVQKLRSDGSITLADSIHGVVTGKKRPQDLTSTHFYNISYSNSGFTVRNSMFKPQRRHAMLVRSSHGLIENNTIIGVGGSAVEMSNEMGGFYEGPFPHNNTIKNNTIRNTQRPAILIRTKTVGNGVAQTKNIKVKNNNITVLPSKLGININNAKNIKLTNNKILNQNGNAISNKAIKIKH